MLAAHMLGVCLNTLRVDLVHTHTILCSHTLHWRLTCSVSTAIVAMPQGWHGACYQGCRTPATSRSRTW